MGTDAATNMAHPTRLLGLYGYMAISAKVLLKISATIAPTTVEILFDLSITSLIQYISKALAYGVSHRFTT